jgi:hypothetical protein
VLLTTCWMHLQNICLQFSSALHAARIWSKPVEGLEFGLSGLPIVESFLIELVVSAKPSRQNFAFTAQFSRSAAFLAFSYQS